MRWVRLHPYNIAQKVQIVVEHFRENVAPLLGGQAKAMVVTASRVEAVRWQLAIDSYIKGKGYPIGTLVAFSGEVDDPDSGPEPFTEHSKTLNPKLRGRDIREAFGTAEYQVLLVANKFQTGFDQPLLCGMYVGKRLAGIQAVQTLSRLNRAHPGKDTTYVLDFVNEPDEVLAAFRTYYETAELSGVTDPALVLDLRGKLDASGHYDDNEVERVVAVELNPRSSQAELSAAIEPVADRLLRAYRSAAEDQQVARAREDEKAQQQAQDTLDALQLFKRDLGAYLRVYTFLSQIFDYGNTGLEKRAIFFRRLLPLLEFGREREGVDLSKVVLTHHRLIDAGRRALALSAQDPTKLDPMTAPGGGTVQEKEKALLTELIARVNELFDGVTDDDKLVYVNGVLKGKLLASEILVQQAASNTREQFASSPDLASELMGAIIDAFAAHSAMSRQALDSERVRAGLKDVLLGPGQLYEALRAKGEAARRADR